MYINNVLEAKGNAVALWKMEKHVFHCLDYKSPSVAFESPHTYIRVYIRIFFFTLLCSHNVSKLLMLLYLIIKEKKCN